MSDSLILALDMAGLAFTFAYLYAVFRLHACVEVEKPDWVSVRSVFDPFYAALLRALNPRVGLAVVGVALSSRASQLASPIAARYVLWIRLSLPGGMACILFPCLTRQSIGNYSSIARGK